MAGHRIFTTSMADIWPHYIAKAERKGRNAAEVEQVTQWLTGYDADGLRRALDDRVDVETFFAQSPRFNPDASLITGVICGHRVEEIEDPLMRKVRQLDKLVDELAKGRPMAKVLRTAPADAAATPAR